MIRACVLFFFVALVCMSNLLAWSEQPEGKITAMGAVGYFKYPVVVDHGEEQKSTEFVIYEDTEGSLQIEMSGTIDNLATILINERVATSEELRKLSKTRVVAYGKHYKPSEKQPKIFLKLILYTLPE